MPTNRPAAYDETLTPFVGYLGIDTFNPTRQRSPSRARRHPLPLG